MGLDDLANALTRHRQEGGDLDDTDDVKGLRGHSQTLIVDRRKRELLSLLIDNK